jgi:type II secretory pathway pseudopilin PulG
VELMIVITIAALILGLLVVGMQQLVAGSKKDRAHTIMQTLSAAHAEYRAQVGEVINIGGGIGNNSFPNPRFPMEWEDSGGNIQYPANAPGDDSQAVPDSSIEKFLVACWQIQASREMVRSISSTYLLDNDGDGLLEVVDPWETALEYCPDNVDNNGNAIDNRLPLRAEPFFASAGPDKSWGTEDDIYSFELER